MCKKLILLFMLFYFVLFCSFSQPIKFKPIDWNTLDNNILNLELDMKELQINNNNLQTFLEEQNEVLSNSATTIGEIKQQLRIIKENYQQMENILYNKLDYTDNGNSNDNLFDE